MTKFGAEIEVNGARPDWLNDGEVVRCERYITGNLASDCWWTMINVIRVRADHPYYGSMNYNPPMESHGVEVDEVPQWAVDRAAEYTEHDDGSWVRAFARWRTIPSSSPCSSTMRAAPGSRRNAAVRRASSFIPSLPSPGVGRTSRPAA